MGASRWLPALVVIVAAASSWIGTAMAATYSVACDYTAITNAIAGAVPGDIIQIAAGTATLTAAQVITISNSTMGISLIGAGPGQTTLQKPYGSTNQNIIFIGETNGALGPGLPTTITNISFRNTGVIDGPRGDTNSTFRAISIRGVGGTDLNRGQIYNCEFFDFSDSAIVLADLEISPIYWDFHNNLFNGSRIGIYLNGNGNISIYDNTMRNFVVGVATDANDLFSDVLISGNTFLGGPYIPSPFNYYGILLSDSSLSSTASRSIIVRNNIITHSTWGIYIYKTTTGGRFHNLNGVDIEHNSIYGNTLLGATGLSVPRDINSQSIANLTGAAHNWWGSNTGPSATSLYSPNGTSITYSPWIFSYIDDPAKAGSPGFWPINIVEWDGSTASPTQAPSRAPTAQGVTYSPTQAPTAAPVVSPTPVGDNVVVPFNESGSGQGGVIDFTEVDGEGVTTVVQVNTDPSNPFFVPPRNFALGDPATYYDISTNASYSGPIVVCLNYPANSFPPETVPQLFHFVGNQWVDVTTQVDTVARVVCGTVSSLSPFALGFLVLNRGPLVLKRLALSNPSTKLAAARGKGSWSLYARLNASTAAATFLAQVDTNGIEFELFGGLGLIDRVSFAPEECGLQRRQTQVLCRRKNQTYALKASFQKEGRAKTDKTTFSVSASFAKRRFDITTKSLKGIVPLEVRMTTTTALGIVTADATKCGSSATKVRCKN